MRESMFNFVLLLMRAETVDRIQKLVQKMLDHCNDPDQLAEGLLFAQGVQIGRASCRERVSSPV